jgi:signal transduction histidine kinase
VPVHLHDRRFPRWRLFAVVVLIVLLTTLGTLQYRWVGTVSEAERARMRESLQTRAAEFTREFDRELTRVYLGFHVEADPFEANPAVALADALARAQSGSAAGLVKDVFLVGGQDPHAGMLQRLDAAARTLSPTDWPPPLDAWRRRVEGSAPAGAGPLSSIAFSEALDATVPALVIPMPHVRRIESGDGNRRSIALLPDPNGLARTVIVWLDAERLRRQLLEPLVTKYFGEADSSAYIVVIVERDDPSRAVYASPPNARLDAASADASSGLFDLRIDEVDRLAAAFGFDVSPRPEGTPSGKRAITIVRRTTTSGEGARVLMTGSDHQSAWQARLRYRGGSLESIVAQSRRRNLAIGLGVLGLLGASFILVIVAAERQQRLARQQMEFVAAVSHELRTPLAVICSAGENLADGVVAEGEQVKRYGSLVETEGRRLGDMVERVLLFAGIGAGVRIAARGDVDVAQVIAEAVHGVAADARDRGVTVAVRPAGALPPLRGDADALRSAVQNIIGNAVKYSQSGASVEVTTELVNGSVLRIRVADRGIGIDAGDLAHIFQPFYRGRRAVDAQVRGTGVGLSVVLHVVQSHGGDIHVDSRAGQGTTVTMVLPVGEASDQADGRRTVVRLRGPRASAAS